VAAPVPETGFPRVGLRLRLLLGAVVLALLTYAAGQLVRHYSTHPVPGPTQVRACGTDYIPDTTMSDLKIVPKIESKAQIVAEGQHPFAYLGTLPGGQRVWGTTDPRLSLSARASGCDSTIWVQVSADGFASYGIVGPP